MMLKEDYGDGWVEVESEDHMKKGAVPKSFLDMSAPIPPSPEPPGPAPVAPAGFGSPVRQSTPRSPPYVRSQIYVLAPVFTPAIQGPGSPPPACISRVRVFCLAFPCRPA